MISKRVVPSCWFDDEPTVNFVKVHSRGLDRQDMLKHARSEFLFGSDIKPEKGHSFLHLITMGAGERYGSNSNADYFNKTAREVTCPSPITPSQKTITLGGGLLKYHPTFTKFAAVYREHMNSKKGGAPQGEVVAEAFNPIMDRGELIIKVANDRWSRDLDKVARNEPIYFSMGTGVPYDICSICHNKAKTRANYCSHMRYSKLQLDKEGNQVFAYNDKPHFHDISEVATPADKIAFGLRKVASGGQLVSQYASDAALMYIPVALIDKLGSGYEADKIAALSKVSEMEKRILAQGMLPDEEAISEVFGKELEECDLKKLASFPLKDVLGAFKTAGVLLPPKSFVRLVTKRASGHIPGLEGLPAAVKTVYSVCQKEGSLDDLIEDSTYDAADPRYWTSIQNVVQKTAADHSLREDIMERRVLHSSIVAPNLIKSASRILAHRRISAESSYLAKEYAKYQVSFMAGTDPIFAACAAIQNQSC